MRRLIGALCVVAACDGGGSVEDPPSYLLADRAAREAGWTLGGAPLGAVPVELDGAAKLRGPAGEVPLDVPDGALAHLRGGGVLELYALDGDVRADRVQLEASEVAAQELATIAGAVAIGLGGERWELSGDELYAALAASSGLTPAAILEAMPVPIEAEAGLPVVGWVARGGGPAAMAGADASRMPARVATAAPMIGPALPGGLRCEDPVAGVWVARSYRSDAEDWHDHELRIERAGRLLTVRGLHHSWEGPKAVGVPPLCDEGGPAWNVIATRGRATFDGGQLQIRGTKVVSSTHTCGPRELEYHLDHFTGAVAGDVFDSVNNDGGIAIDRPYRFERVACK